MINWALGPGLEETRLERNLKILSGPRLFLAPAGCARAFSFFGGVFYCMRVV